MRAAVNPCLCQLTKLCLGTEVKGTAVILYITGTIGVPKGVMLTHANLLFAAPASTCLIGYVLDVGQVDGRARCHLTLSEAHLNRHHVLHGGIATALLDNAMGAIARLVHHFILSSGDR